MNVLTINVSDAFLIFLQAMPILFDVTLFIYFDSLISPLSRLIGIDLTSLTGSLFSLVGDAKLNSDGQKNEHKYKKIINELKITDTTINYKINLLRRILVNISKI